jgi:hypothetical protein
VCVWGGVDLSCVMYHVCLCLCRSHSPKSRSIHTGPMKALTHSPTNPIPNRHTRTGRCIQSVRYTPKDAASAAASIDTDAATANPQEGEEDDGGSSKRVKPKRSRPGGKSFLRCVFGWAVCVCVRVCVCGVESSDGVALDRIGGARLFCSGVCERVVGKCRWLDPPSCLLSPLCPPNVPTHRHRITHSLSHPSSPPNTPKNLPRQGLVGLRRLRHSRQRAQGILHPQRPRRQGRGCVRGLHNNPV